MQKMKKWGQTQILGFGSEQAEKVFPIFAIFGSDPIFGIMVFQLLLSLILHWVLLRTW